MRKSIVTTQLDSKGSYEIEIFEHTKPKRVIVCSHGNGVRRWDGEQFFYQVAEHFFDSAILLVDQNQTEGEGCKLNPIPIMAARVCSLIDLANQKYPGVPIVLIGHSMGCGVITQMDLQYVDSIVFVAPAVGDVQSTLIYRYGPNISSGKVTISSDGLIKHITPEYFASGKGIIWEKEYLKLIKRFAPIHVFESENDEILGNTRFEHRTMDFTSYTIIKGAKHNLSDEVSATLFKKLGSLLNI